MERLGEMKLQNIFREQCADLLAKNSNHSSYSLIDLVLVPYFLLNQLYANNQKIKYPRTL